MSGDAVLIERLLAGGAIALVMSGAATALIVSNAIKRLAGLGIAGLGALAALALWAPPAATAGAVIVFVQVAVGVAIVVRLQESYGSIEMRDIDAADAELEPRGKRR
jgi:hypothetical protein